SWRRDFCFFFFQAEDGIRYWSVTGVKTCALPISRAGIMAHRGTRCCRPPSQARARDGGRQHRVPRWAMMPARVAAEDVVLSIEHVAVNFGGLVALSDLNFTVCNGEIVGLIGPNGAGKTTAFNVFTGFLKPTNGEVRYRN